MKEHRIQYDEGAEHLPTGRLKIKKQKSWALRILLAQVGGFWGFLSFFTLAFREGRELGPRENLEALPALLMGLIFKLPLLLLERLVGHGPAHPALSLFLFGLAVTLCIFSGALLGLIGSLIIEQMARAFHRIFAAGATQRRTLTFPAIAGLVMVIAFASCSFAYLSYQRWYQALAEQRRHQIIPASDIIVITPQDMSGAVQSVPEPRPMPNN